MNAADHRFLVCRAGTLQFAVSLADLREVNRYATCYQLPHAPSGVRGLLNLRSVTYLILDSGRLFNGASVQITSKTRLLFCKPHVGPNWALLVCEVGDVLYCEPEFMAEMDKDVGGACGKSDNLLDLVVEAYAPFGARAIPIVSLEKLYANVSASVLDQSQAYALARVASGSSS